MEIFGGSGVTAGVYFKVSKNLCQEKTFFFSYLYSEIKIKPKNHGIRESGKTPPFIFFSYHMFASEKIQKGYWQ